MDPLVDQAQRARRRLVRRRAEGGFTLIEVMVALAILGFGLLGLAAMQLHALQQSSAGRHTSDASAVARSALEQVHRLPWSALDSALAAWTAPDWDGASATLTTEMALPGGGTSTEKSYALDWRVSEVGSAGCLRDVEVRVEWQEAKVQTPKQVVLATRRYNWGDSGC